MVLVVLGMVIPSLSGLTGILSDWSTPVNRPLSLRADGARMPVLTSMSPIRCSRVWVSLRRRWPTHVYIHLPQSRPCRACPVSGAVLRSSAVGGLPGRFHHPCPEWPEPARHGASAPCLGAAWVLYNNRTLMTAFPFRSCWKRHLPHVALGSIFSFARSDLKAWPVLPSGEDNRQQRSGNLTSREGPCETTAALRVPASEDDRVDRRVQVPVIPASTSGARQRPFPNLFRVLCPGYLASLHRGNDASTKSPVLWINRPRHPSIRCPS